MELWEKIKAGVLWLLPASVLKILTILGFSITTFTFADDFSGVLYNLLNNFAGDFTSTPWGERAYQIFLMLGLYDGFQYLLAAYSANLAIKLFLGHFKIFSFFGD